MSETRREQWSAASGFGAVAAGLAAAALEPDWPDLDDAAAVADFVAGYSGRLIAQSLLFIVSTGFFLWFIATLWQFLRRTGVRTIAAAVLAAGVTWATLSIGGQAFQISEARISDRDAGADLVAALGDLSFVTLGIANLPLAVMLIAVGIGSLLTRAFPAWLAWLALVVAAGYLVLFLGVAAESGPLAADGWLTIALYPLFIVWLIPAIVVMIGRLGRRVPGSPS